MHCWLMRCGSKKLENVKSHVSGKPHLIHILASFSFGVTVCISKETKKNNGSVIEVSVLSCHEQKEGDYAWQRSKENDHDSDTSMYKCTQTNILISKKILILLYFGY